MTDFIKGKIKANTAVVSDLFTPPVPLTDESKSPFEQEKKEKNSPSKRGNFYLLSKRGNLLPLTLSKRED